MGLHFFTKSETKSPTLMPTSITIAPPTIPIAMASPIGMGPSIMATPPAPGRMTSHGRVVSQVRTAAVLPSLSILFTGLLYRERSKSACAAKRRLSRRRLAVGLKTAVLPASHRPFRTLSNYLRRIQSSS